MIQRLAYIDSLRGLSIILIIALHSRLTIVNTEVNRMFLNMELPAFFFISGLFFKRYSGFRQFIIKKVNNLIVPYFFFSYIPFCLLSYFFTDSYSDLSFYILAPIKPYNTPLWFVRCLFFTFLLYYFIDKFTEKKSILLPMSVIAILVLVTCLVNVKYQELKEVNSILSEFSFIINDIQTSFISLPYFFIAQQIKKRGWLEFKINWKLTTLLVSIAIAIAYIFKQGNFVYYYALYGDNVLFGYISSLSSIFAFGLLFAKLKHTGVFQLFGKYSLIVLGCHYVSIIILKTFFWPPSYLVFIITFLLMIPCIYFFKHFFPKFTAQEELFRFH